MIEGMPVDADRRGAGTDAALEDTAAVMTSAFAVPVAFLTVDASLAHAITIAGMDSSDLPRFDAAFARTRTNRGVTVLAEGDASIAPFRFFAAAPIVAVDGSVLGIVAILDRRSRSLGYHEREMLARFGRIVGGHLSGLRGAVGLAGELEIAERHARRERAIREDAERVQRDRENERALYDIVGLAAGDASLDLLLQRLVETVEGIVPDTACAVVRVVDGRLRHARAGAGIPKRLTAVIDGTEIGEDAGSCGAAAYLGRTFVASDIATHPNWRRVGPVALAAGLRSCWSVPVRTATGVVGTFACYSRAARTPDDAELRVLNEAAHVASIVFESHETRERLRALASSDALTGLPNRALFESRLQEALVEAKRTGTQVAVGLLDLDRFKVVNDSLGHAAGDAVLQETGRRLARGLRPGDTLARSGGDEFWFLFTGVSGRAGALAFAEQALAALGAPFHPEGNELFLRGSLGLSLYPEDAAEASQLLRLADRAMYDAKRNGSRVSCPQGPAAGERGITVLALETALAHALENGEFELVYQPIVRMRDRGIFAVEGLIRWNHPTLGFLAPDRFIGLAEETGLIVPIGAWVVEEACRLSKRWSLAGGTGRVGVNVSPRQFEDRNFARTVYDAVRCAGIAPGNLYLEITEGLIMRSPEQVTATLAELRRFGVHSVIDDFGSGYSNLSYLKHFPIESLKIDRGFISEIGASDGAVRDEAIIRAIVAVGTALGLGAVAEGVETETQAEFLRAVGCHLAQGYLFARPMRETALLALGGGR